MTPSSFGWHPMTVAQSTLVALSGATGGTRVARGWSQVR